MWLGLIRQTDNQKDAVNPSLNEAGYDVGPEHYQVLDKKRGVIIPWEQLRLK